MSGTRRARLAVGAVLALSAILYGAPFLLSPRFLYGEDFEYSHRPELAAARTALARDGAMMLWNPNQSAGTPYLGTVQGTFPYFYPPNWLWLAADANAAYELLVVFHVLLAAWGMYRLARRFGQSRCGSLVAGLSYGLSFHTTGLVVGGTYGLLTVYALAPLVVLLLLRQLDVPSIPRCLALAGGLSLTLLSGYPQALYHLALLCLAIAAWHCARRARQRAPWFRSAAGVTASAVLAIALSAAHLFPALEVLPWTTRVGGSPYGGAGVPKHHAFAFENLSNFLVPHYSWSSTGSALMARDLWWDKGVYVGILPLACAVWGALRARRPGVFLLTGAAAVALLDGMAFHLPVHSVLSAVLPGYGSFRVPGRVVWVVVFCVSLLAGHGWDALASDKSRLFPAIAAAAVLAAAVLAWRRLDAPKEAALLAVTGMLGLVPLLPKIRLHATGGPIAVALVAMGTVPFDFMPMKTVDRAWLDRSPWFAAGIAPEERGNHRLLHMWDLDQSYSLHGFRVVRGYGYPMLRHTHDYYCGAWSPRPAFNPAGFPAGTDLSEPEVLDTLNVRWIVSPRSLSPRWIERGRSEEGVLYENPGARGDAFLLGPGAVSATRRTNRIAVDCAAGAPATLVVSESWMPGWRASVDGRRVQVTRYRDALMQVEVPQGVSRVEFVYAPASFRVGLAISGLAALAMIAAGTAAAWRGRKRT
ncbi:MAG: YfhO family protein [Planctomycetes bacterium]|nr:YfhO family protein [Planctomycetota bacterium]